jgi:hypothetical protein
MGHGGTIVREPPGYALSPGGRATRPSPTNTTDMVDPNTRTRQSLH